MMSYPGSPVPSLSTGLLASAMLGAGAFAPGSVLADVTAIFESPEGEMAIEYRDDDHVRMRMADNAFFVIREGKGYMVNREDGEWFVIAVDDMVEMMAAAGARPGVGGEDETEFELNDTGRTETVAGIEGRVYEYAELDSWTGDPGSVTEVVISDDADVRTIYRGIMRSTEILGVMADDGMEGGHPDNIPSLEDSGLLRYGNEWRLVSVHRDPIPDRHFTLPAEPRPLATFGGATPGTDKDHEPGWAEREARDLGRTAADEARDETRRGISGEVREGVRDGVRGLFGR